MNVFRVAVMMNTIGVIAIHSHPSGRLILSIEDKDITDRLIQVGRILDIMLVDHLINSQIEYTSFRVIKLMYEFEQSLKDAPVIPLKKQESNWNNKLSILLIFKEKDIYVEQIA